MKGSWKTNALGIAGSLTVIINVIIMLTDGDPMTNPDWSIAIPAILTGFGLVAARDNTVSDKEAGASK